MNIVVSSSEKPLLARAVPQNTFAIDALISTSLSRSSYDAKRVFAVKKSGSQLTMFF